MACANKSGLPKGEGHGGAGEGIRCKAWDCVVAIKIITGKCGN